MREVRLSETAQRTVNSFNRTHAAQFYELTSILADFFLPLQRAGLLGSSRFYGIDGFRYYDNRFPFVLFLEVVSDSVTEAERILIRTITPVTLS